MEIGEWIKAVRENKILTRKEFGESLGVSRQLLRNIETGNYGSVGYSVAARIIEKFQVRPDDISLDKWNSRLLNERGKGNIASHYKEIIRTAKRFPVWMPNGKEEKPMSKPETTRGNTMLKIAEKPEPSTEEKGIGETTLLLRRIKANRQELRDLESYKEPESQAVQPKSVYERIKSRLVKQKEQEVIEQAKWQAKAELVQGLLLDEKRLTSLRLEQHKASLEKFAKHEQSILSELASLQAKITSQQNELNMLAWSLDNAFAYVVMEDVKDGDC